MPSQSYIEKHSHKNIARSSSEIQRPLEKRKKHIAPVDLIVEPCIKPFIVNDPKLLDLKSKIIWQFIRNER